MSKELIVKHNKLIEANYKLTLQEQKLILTLARKITKEDNNFKKCVFTVEKLSDILGLEKKGYYSELKEITKSLISRVIQIEEHDGLLQVSWLNSAKYYENKGIVELSFSNDLKPYLLQLGEHFTKLEFKQLVNLSSVYAIRIYELCKQYEKIKERTIEIEKLKIMLGIEKTEYKLYGDFKKRVLEIAKREINEKTDINIDFEEIKTGRKVTSIKFLIEKQEEQVKQIETSETKEKKYSEEVESLFCMIKKIEQVECLKDLIKTALKSYNFEYIKSNIKYSNDNAKSNYTAFLKKALKEDYAKIEREKKKKKAEMKRKREEEEEMKSKREEEEKKLTRKLAEEIYETKTEEEIEEYLKNIAEIVKKSVFFDKKEIIIAKIIEELEQ